MTTSLGTPSPMPANPYGTPARSRLAIPPQPSEPGQANGSGPSAPPAQQQTSKPVPAGPPPIDIGLCGAPEGGKTTFLACLLAAVFNANVPPDEWAVTALDDPSEKFMTDRDEEMTIQRRFPSATVALQEYRFRIDGTVVSDRKPGGWLRRGPRVRDIAFSIDVEDRPGNDFKLPADIISPEGLERLAAAKALVFLFDPIREFDRGSKPDGASNWLYFFRLVQRLKSLVDQRGGLIKGRLPHYVAVCVTKFDNPRIFEPAYQQRFVDIDGGLPRVPAELAEDYFDFICRMTGPGGPDSATRQLQMLLKASFDKDRVHYFSTSSVGFYVPPNGRFDIKNYTNINLIDGTMHIRGDVRPINVLEPLVALENRIRNGVWW